MPPPTPGPNETPSDDQINWDSPAGGWEGYPWGLKNFDFSRLYVPWNDDGFVFGVTYWQGSYVFEFHSNPQKWANSLDGDIFKEGTHWVMPESPHEVSVRLMAEFQPNGVKDPGGHTNIAYMQWTRRGIGFGRLGKYGPWLGPVAVGPGLDVEVRLDPGGMPFFIQHGSLDSKEMGGMDIREWRDIQDAALQFLLAAAANGDITIDQRLSRRLWELGPIVGPDGRKWARYCVAQDQTTGHGRPIEEVFPAGFKGVYFDTSKGFIPDVQRINPELWSLLIERFGSEPFDGLNLDGSNVVIQPEPTQAESVLETASVQTDLDPVSPSQTQPETESLEVELEPEKAETEIYTVQAGDSLWKIAKEHLGDGNRWVEIAETSGVRMYDPDGVDGPLEAYPLIHPGQELVISTS